MTFEKPPRVFRTSSEDTPLGGRRCGSRIFCRLGIPKLASHRGMRVQIVYAFSRLLSSRPTNCELSEQRCRGRRCGKLRVEKQLSIDRSNASQRVGCRTSEGLRQDLQTSSARDAGSDHYSERKCSSNQLCGYRKPSCSSWLPDPVNFLPQIAMIDRQKRKTQKQSRFSRPEERVAARHVGLHFRKRDQC